MDVNPIMERGNEASGVMPQDGASAPSPLLKMAENVDYFKLINTLAIARNVKKDARRKWYERGTVPYKWRIELGKDAAAIGQSIPEEAFKNFWPERTEK